MNRSGLRSLWLVALAVVVAASVAAAAGVASGFGGVEFEGDETAVFGENDDRLPPGCTEIAGESEVSVTAVSAGIGYPLFEYRPATVEVGSCERVTVTFASDTRIRHQWIVRGLPRDTYPDGYFGIEVDGAAEETASFVTPADPRTLPVESTVGSQSESGLRGQLKVDGGDGDVEGAPGVTQHGWSMEDGGSDGVLSLLPVVLGFLVGVVSVGAAARVEVI